MANSSVLKSADIQAAQKVITDYESACEELFTKIQSSIKGLTAAGASFNGDSAVGYNEFFTQITPVLTTRLYGAEDSLMGSIKTMLKDIEKSLLDTVDPELGNANRSAVASAEAGADVSAETSIN